MKKVIILLLTLSLGLGLSACSFGSYSVMMGKTVEKTTLKSMTYSKMNGHKSYKIKLKEDEETLITTDIVTEKGTIDVTVTTDDDAQTVIFEEDAIETSNFTITIPESGTYLIKIEADDHRGGFSFEW